MKGPAATGLAILTGASGLLIALRALAGGPITVVTTIHRPLNLESAAAVSFLLSLILLASRDGKTYRLERAGRWVAGALGLALLLTLVCYWRSLWFPFTSDDYVLVARALRGELLPRVLTEGDAGVAFRPFTRFLMAVQGWAGSADPVWWHSIGLLFHLLNCALVYLLARWFVAPGAAVFAAAVFGLHATHPEAVCWMNSRSDVLATSCVLGALLLFLATWRRPHRGLTAAALALVTLGVLNKESAYAFVPLAWALLAANGKPGWRGLRATAPFVALEAVLFAWRWAVLGGLGGYVNQVTSRSVFLSIDGLHVLKVVCWRVWAILFFPVHWELPGTLFCGLTLIPAAAALVALSRARANRRTLLALVGFVVAAFIPVLPLALVGMDLLGGRLYYLPSVGFALLLAVALDSLRPELLRMGATAALLLFHFAALEHQLNAWQSVTTLAHRTCADAAAIVDGSAGSPVLFRPLPDTIDGVFFLGNGFQECVELQTDRRLPALVEGRKQQPPSGARVFRWDAQQRMLIRTAP